MYYHVIVWSLNKTYKQTCYKPKITKETIMIKTYMYIEKSSLAYAVSVTWLKTGWNSVYISKFWFMIFLIWMSIWPCNFLLRKKGYYSIVYSRLFKERMWEMCWITASKCSPHFMKITFTDFVMNFLKPFEKSI